jgi:hypothetical protein
MARSNDGATPNVGDDLVEAFAEMAAYLRGEITLEYYEVDDTLAKGGNAGENDKQKAAARKSLPTSPPPQPQHPPSDRRSSGSRS